MGVLTFSLPPATRQHWPRLLPYLTAYNGGRITSYTLAGAALGTVGGSLRDTATLPSLHFALQAVAALLLVGIGLYLAGWFPKFAVIERIGVPLWRHLEPIGRRLLPVRSPLHAYLYGMIWGWLPCGLVYSTLIWTLTAHGPEQGALFMFLFGLGTLPAALGTGIFTGCVGRLSRLPYIRPLAGALVIAMGVATLVFAGQLGDAVTQNKTMERGVRP